MVTVFRVLGVNPDRVPGLNIQNVSRLILKFYIIILKCMHSCVCECVFLSSSEFECECLYLCVRDSVTECVCLSECVYVCVCVCVYI